MLCFSRPVHTALTIAYTLANKSVLTDFYMFYGIHRNQPPPHPVLDSMLQKLNEKCGIPLIYMHEDQPRATEGNVNTLMKTLHSLEGYSCYAKIDDDVLVGKGTDVVMADILLATESHNMMMLMGQAVPAHMRMRNPFCWEAMVNNYRVVQRSDKACPMETYTFVSKKCLDYLRARGLSVGCDNSKGTYGPYTRKLSVAGAKVGLVLVPSITMQHIGLTTTIEPGNPARNWAPARRWEPRDTVIEVPGFDFSAWEMSHKTNTQSKVAIDTILGLRSTATPGCATAIDILLEELTAYSQGKFELQVDSFKTQMGQSTGYTPPQIPDSTILRKLPDGRVVRSPGPVKRVVIRKNT
jgi:hypothetical protein